MTDDKYVTYELEDVTPEQHNTIYRCSCGWEGKVSQMINDSDISDPIDAVWSDFCCPKCWKFYLCLENWEKAK